MKITETVERDCCATKDLRPYSGMVCSKSRENTCSPLLFCKHCGQVWVRARRTDAAGSAENVLAPLKIHVHECHEEE
jgi:hypothetical protein